MSGGADDSVMCGGHCSSLQLGAEREGDPPQESDLHTPGLHGAQESCLCKNKEPA